MSKRNNRRPTHKLCVTTKEGRKLYFVGTGQDMYRMSGQFKQKGAETKVSRF